MKKNTLNGIIVIIAIITIVTSNVNSNSKNEALLLTLANVEALASDETNDPCDENPFYAGNQALKSVRCMKYPLVFGYKLSCKEEYGRCCDPTTQTKCE